MNSYVNEYKGLAKQALKNAFYTAFSQLVNDTLRAAEGLGDPEDLRAELGDLTSVYGADETAKGDTVSIGGSQPGLPGLFGRVGAQHDTLWEAMLNPEHEEITLNGEVVFVRVGGEWTFNE